MLFQSTSKKGMVHFDMPSVCMLLSPGPDYIQPKTWHGKNEPQAAPKLLQTSANRVHDLIGDTTFLR